MGGKKSYFLTRILCISQGRLILVEDWWISTASLRSEPRGGKGGVGSEDGLTTSGFFNRGGVDNSEDLASNTLVERRWGDEPNYS